MPPGGGPPGGSGDAGGPEPPARHTVGAHAPVTWAPVRVERVVLAEPRGFCAGVQMAIKALTWMVRVFEPPVYCYHEIVHNKVVV
ncbi:MAG: hypothetical protein ACRDYD_14135, partial [Acidimicrobiales bacterium]